MINYRLKNPNTRSNFTSRSRHLTINTNRYFELHSSLSQNDDCVSLPPLSPDLLNWKFKILSKTIKCDNILLEKYTGCLKNVVCKLNMLVWHVMMNRTYTGICVRKCKKSAGVKGKKERISNEVLIGLFLKNMVEDV